MSLSSYRITPRLIVLAAALAGATGCGAPEEAIGSASAHAGHSAGPSVKRDGPPPGDLARQLAALQRATAPFHNFEKAKAAGYVVRVTGCMENEEGAQGFHYGKDQPFDASVNLLEPELLMYEPRAGGTLHLVGVEYAIPVGLWTSPDRPELAGQQFHVNPAFGLWVLHIWNWRDNPLGMFADWNPRVSCEHEDAVD